jgi:GAF domain-containing protein
MEKLSGNLLTKANALLSSEEDFIALCANISALIFHHYPNLNWVGFYRVLNDELVLGPFQGKVACVRIKSGQGVVGTCYATKVYRAIEDVTKEKNHIVCDEDSRSEYVFPIFKNQEIIAILDIDSPIVGRFSQKEIINLHNLSILMSKYLSKVL